MRTHKRPKARSRRGAPWSTAEIKLIGKLPDSVVARRTHRTIKEVEARREELRIGLKTGPRRWTRREILLLGTMNDYEAARRLRRHPQDVRQQRLALKIAPFKPAPKSKLWEPWEIKLLGTMRDETVVDTESIPEATQTVPVDHVN